MALFSCGQKLSLQALERLVGIQSPVSGEPCPGGIRTQALWAGVKRSPVEGHNLGVTLSVSQTHHFL